MRALTKQRKMNKMAHRRKVLKRAKNEEKYGQLKAFERGLSKLRPK